MPNDGVDESNRAISAENFEASKLICKLDSLVYRDTCDDRCMAKLAAITENRERLRQPNRSRVEPQQARAQLQSHAVDAAESRDVVERAHSEGVPGGLHSAQQLAQIEGIPSGSSVTERYSVVIRGAFQRAAYH